MSKQSVLEQANSLSKAEQLEIAMELWDSVEETYPSIFPLTPQLKEELDRRIAADDADPTPAKDWVVLPARSCCVEKSDSPNRKAGERPD